MKTIIRTLVLSSMAISLGLITSCEKDMLNSNSPQYASIIDVTSDGTTTVINDNLQLALLETPALTDAELASLVKMKDEEKLARDVYSALYAKWNSQVFSRISMAESNHLNAVILLLKYYGIGDTLVGETGKFTDSEVQALHDELIAKGNISVEEAFKTGSLIEEMDIKDLQESIGITSNENIITVFENLTKGSRNHLRAFYRQLSGLGIVYTPVYISQADYDQIVSSPMEKGKQYKMKGKGKGKGNCDGKGNGSGQGKKNGKR